MDATQLAGAQALVGATRLAGGPVDQEALRQAEQAVGFEWAPGDVILDLYEVRPVTEGFGKGAKEKPYHQGGFGRVYKVWHRTWRREMAVKTPRAGAFITQAQKDAFTRECETWVNLGLHAHIAACHYVREVGGVPRVFSEYADAGTLEEWIQSRRLYDGDVHAALARMLDASIQLAWGLHYAHERGVIHQDVKPLNALLWNDGALKVTDFGLVGARFKAGLADLADAAAGGMHTIVAPVGGMTLAYCSPEQAAGLTLDRRTDVWSWAVSVMEMFQGGVTWQSGSLAAEALEAFLEDNGEEEGIPAMPAGAADLLRRCFQHKPGDRPHTLHECAAALREVLQAETGIFYPRAEPQVIGDTPDTLNNRALSLLDLGKPDEAEGLFDQALEQDKHHVAATYNRGLMRWRAAKTTDAQVLAILDDIKRDRWKDEAVECALGWIRIENGDLKRAQSNFGKAIELGDSSEARSALELARSFAEDRSASPQQTAKSIGQAASIVPDVTQPEPFGIGVIDFRVKLAQLPQLTPFPIEKLALDYSFDPFKEHAAEMCLRTFEGHTEYVNSVAFSPDGRFALSGSNDKKLRLSVMSTGQCLRTFEGHADHVTSVAFSPDSRFALSGSDDKTLKFWDTATAQCLRTFEGHTEDVSSVAFSPDGRFALSGSDDTTLRLWDVSSGQCLHTFEGHTEDVNSVAYSPDGRFALSGSDDKTLRLWDVSTGQCLRTFGGHTASVNSVAYSPDGRFGLSGSNDERLKLWEIATGQCLRTFVGNTNGVRSVAFAPDGRFALSGGADSTLRVWDVSAGRCLRTFQGHFTKAAPDPFGYDGARWITAVAVSSDGHLALSGCKALRLWDISAAERCYAAPWIYSRSATAEEAAGRQARHNAELRHAREALEGGRIAEALNSLRQARAVEGFERSPESLELQARVGARSRVQSCSGGWLKHTFKGHTSGVWSVAFSPDGCFGLSGSGDGSLKLWDVSTGQCLRTFEGHASGVWSVAFSPEGCSALSGSDDRKLKLWDAFTGQCLRTFEGHTSSVLSVTISPDGRYALSGNRPKTVFTSFGGKGNTEASTLRLWDLATGRCVRTFTGHSGAIECIAFSPDGRFALSGNGYSDDDFGQRKTGQDKSNELRLWDVSTGQCLRTFSGHYGDVCAVAFSPDGRFAISGSRDKTLRLWDVVSGKCLACHDDDGPINSVAFSPNGRFALAGGDKMLTLCEVFPGALQHRRDFDGHTNSVASVAFSPDGRFALTGSADTSMKLWEFDWAYEYDPECVSAFERRTSEYARLHAEAVERRRSEGVERKRLADESKRLREAQEAWNRSVRGRIANFFGGKGRNG